MRRLALVTCLLITFPAAARAQCVLSGAATIDRVRVTPSGAPAFVLGLEGYEASVAPLGGGRVRVESANGLVWTGTAEERDVQVFFAREVALAGGAIVVGPSTRIERVHVGRRDEPRVDVTLTEGVALRRASVACADLALEESEEEPAPAEPTEQGDSLPRERSLRISARPGARSIIVHVRTPASLRLATIEERDGWTHIRHAFRTGARIDGWVRTSDLRDAPPFATYAGIPIRGGRGFCGRGASHTYFGPATLLAGSEIRTAIDGAVWAVASEDVEVRVMIGWGAPWAQIESIDGLRMRDVDCENILEVAWVPRSDLRLPPNTP